MAAPPLHFLKRWRLRHADNEQELCEEEPKDWTASSLAQAYMSYQLDKRHAVSERQTLGYGSPSLSSLAVGSILGIIQSSTDLDTEIKAIAETLPLAFLKIILQDHRTSYQILRAFSRLPEFTATTSMGIRALVDLDEAVLRNERYIKSLKDTDRRSRYLVSLEDLCKTLPLSDRSISSAKFIRQDPPKGGLEVLDAKRRRKAEICSSNAGFSSSFNKITRNVLLGLNWSNVIVAGGMAVTALLQVDSCFQDTRFDKPDINLYIYGLEPDEANHKTNEIHDTWARNITPDAHRLVVKSTKSIALLADYPYRPIEIALKLYSTPIDVLLDFDLDACAIAFDGSRVFMLPRCARAIETGYSVFTMDLVWGQQLGSRRASSIRRLFKYAERGFGVRFLASLAKSLEANIAERLKYKDSYSHGSLREGCVEDGQPATWEKGTVDQMFCAEVSGVKTLKRMSRSAQEFVRQVYFAAPTRCYRRESPCFGRRHISHQAWRSEVGHVKVPHINPSWFDPESEFMKMSFEGGFEMLMRYSELWRLYAFCEATFCVSEESRNEDGPDLSWGRHFRVQNYEDQIVSYNSRLWDDVKNAICLKLGIPARTVGYFKYATRRMRCIVSGPVFDITRRVQITIPILIPWGLENYLAALPEQYDLPSNFMDFKSLIPLHDPNTYDPSVTGTPSLRDTASESGNLRYWVITEKSMWANQHPVLDEYSKLMRCLFEWFKQACSAMSLDPRRLDMATSYCTASLAGLLRKHIVLLKVAGDEANYLRQSLLFKSWALKTLDAQSDELPVFGQGEEEQWISEEEEEMFEEDQGDEGEREVHDDESTFEVPSPRKYPLPYTHTWEDGDEGDWVGPDVPAWVDVSQSGTHC